MATKPEPATLFRATKAFIGIVTLPAKTQEKGTTMNAAFNEVPGATAVDVMVIAWLAIIIAAPILALL